MYCVVWNLCVDCLQRFGNNVQIMIIFVLYFIILFCFIVFLSFWMYIIIYVFCLFDQFQLLFTFNKLRIYLTNWDTEGLEYDLLISEH